MAYATLISLENSLNQLMLYTEQYPKHHDLRKQIQSFLPKLKYLLEFLEDSSHRSDEKTSSLITRIRDAAYRAQYLVDLYCYETDKMAIRGRVAEPKDVDLQKIIQEIDAVESDIKEQTGSATEEVKNIDSRLVPNDLQLQNSFRAGLSGLASEDIIVGFEDLYLEIMEELTDQQSELEFVSITGMGGSGKTTLAKIIYNNSLVTYHFEIRAWVVASQPLRNILLNILDSMNMLSAEMHGQDGNKLKELVFLTLKQRRYLIIIDDIWDTSVWDEMRKVLPNNKYGSRVLLTTRLADVAAYVSSSGHSHHVSLLSSEDSWILLRAKVFGKENCPPELQQIGQKISERCGGLPLSLVVMGGLLSRKDETKEVWLNFEKNVTSTDLYPCLEILKLSYDYLPQRLKPCFLYMALFQEDEEIPVSKLIKLWVADGFLKQVQHQDPEAVAEKCLMELVDRSMILVSKHNSEGNIKTCRMHRLLRDLCLTEAKREKFLSVRTPKYADTFQETPHDHLRIRIHSKTPDLILSDTIPSFSFVRSLLCTGSVQLSSRFFLKFKLLRTLDAIKVAFPMFPPELLELLNLRYISLTCLEHDIPPSISNLQYLQTLIIHQEHSANLPVEIWNMTHLRNIEFEEGSLPDPIGTRLGIDGRPLVLTNLHTLSGIRNLRFTEDVLKRIPQISTLKISYDYLDEQNGWSYYEFQNLVNLQLLKALKIYVDIDTLKTWHPMGSKLEFQFPPSLKELTLCGCSISWEDLSVIGRLPKLEVLKLRYRACLGDHWRPNEGEFCQLKLLLLQSSNLVHWEIEYDNLFSCLEQLIVRDCDVLEKIPYQMGESSTLTKIELDEYNESLLASADKIQEMQHDIGNDDFQVILRTAKKSSSSNSLIHPRILQLQSKIEERNAKRFQDAASIFESIGETKQQKTPGLAPTGSPALDHDKSSTILPRPSKLEKRNAKDLVAIFESIRERRGLKINIKRLKITIKRRKTTILAPTGSPATGSVSLALDHKSSTISQGGSKIKERNAERFESIGETEQQETPRLASRGTLVVDSSSFAGNHESSMVGFHEDFSQIKNWLTESTHHLEVMKIVGMAGIGKTTLARLLFEHAATDSSFEFHAWVSVSRTNDVQKLIRGILDSMRPKEYELDDKSIEQLKGNLYKSLESKRYLIVLDDVWDIHVWDEIKGSFPDDNTRSRIILTTRLTKMDLKVRFSKIHHMRLLPPEMSWTLFCTKVFGKEKCPQELEDAAKHILHNCRGLPLAIIVIGGLLSKVSRTKDDWQHMLETMNSTITPEEHLKGILSLGYKYLPLNLRACFRSMIISAEDYELSVPQLVRLWIDEGLVDKTDSTRPDKTESMLSFLKDLIDRSLIVVCKQNKEGEVETCGIPSIWQDYFVANNPDILQILLSKSNQSTAPKEGMEDLPRSYSKGVSMTVEEGRKGKINCEEDLGISMDILFNNRYTMECIRYCSLFPMDFEFTKDILVSLWMAQGGTIAGNDAFIEEACIQCFDILLKVKYIVPTGYDPYGDQIKYTVGGEMNEFLQNHLIQPRFSKELDGKHIEESKLEHLSLSFKEIGQINFEIIKRLSCLQTLIIHGCSCFKVTHLPFDLFLELKSLRILSVSHTDIVELPSSIKSSKALRYLDMSETPIRWLPESMCNLSNLQTLKLENCLGLIRLPKHTKELINLRHLILDVARQLQSMPEGIRNLSKLRTLRAFLVGEDDGYRINELKHMNKLSGSLRILKLENIKTSDQAAEASLCSKQDLKKIELQWSDFQDKKISIEEEILTCLEPPLGIQELKIFYYSGGELPSWISKPSFSELFSITIHKCRYCTSLPSLGQLPSLKFLSIVGMNEVLEIDSFFCGEQGNQHQPSFPMLEKLSFDSMSKLEKWTEIRTGDFPRLENLMIKSCPKINCLPSLSRFKSLKHMEISYCPEFSCLPDGGLPSTLESLVSCLPDGGLQSTLESLMIKDCPTLNECCSNWSKIANVVPVFYIDNMKVHKK